MTGKGEIDREALQKILSSRTFTAVD
jgi:hypothetical protein